MGRVIGFVLVGAGAFLIALAPLLRFQVADRLIAAPADQYSVTTLRADNARYFNVGDLKVLDGTLDITVTVKGDVEQASGDRVVWDQFTAVNDVTNNKQGISMSQFRSAFNKYTGEGLNCCGVNVDKEPVALDGQIFLFPFNAEKKTYKVFNSVTAKAFDARFVGEDVVEGLPVHKYEQVIPPTKTQTITAPASVVGVKDKTGDVKVDRWYDGKITFWVEPTSGVPVKQEQQRHEVLKTQDGVERKPALVATATYTPEAVDEWVRTATNARNQITLLKTTIPLVLLVVGVVLLAAGVLFALRGGRSARHAADS
ncbi:DUF3068 domain-containing protein [Thermopolyspora sp. NPDC052614]|uniref:DUF3068 domain-containing protein n=1 Tax=Thermopolyspora sp. NPDC052614 TaxID=3155682 RepID=UPI003416AFB7